jgi:pyruvate dehydrogenase E2 component (dihydrolipoamide acetyltransferase)
MADVVMPRLSDSMEEGTILKWLKADGDEIAKGDEIVEIETDKATMTYEADAAGALSIVAQEGETLPVGGVIARLGEAGAAERESTEEDEKEDEPEADDDEQGAQDGAGREEEAEEEAASVEQASGNGAPSEAPARPSASATAEPEAAPQAPEPEGNGGRPKASPVARRLARERGIDLTALEGTGPGGRIVKADVEAAAGDGGAKAREAEAEPAPEKEPARAPEPARAEAGTAKGEVTVQELTRTQQVIARRMAESKATIPEFTISTDVDMEGAVELRAALKEAAEGTGGVAPSYNDMVIKAAALALREFPRVNGSYKDGRFELYSRVNVGVAVATEEALVVPTIFDADRKSLGEIARGARGLAERVRDGSIRPPELGGGTFTVSNLGMHGVTEFTAVINPPQAAILAVGTMEPRAVVHDDEIVARHMLSLRLACDHRILYGADAAAFLARVRALLEQPLSLAL